MIKVIWAKRCFVSINPH